MYDIAIIGGGPSGATLARFLGKKYKILLLEKRVFTEDPYPKSMKCCGGLIAPDAQKMLASFGLGIPKSVLLSPQLFSVRTIDMQNSLEKYYQRHYINIDREQFDFWLETLIPSEVTVLNGAVFKTIEQKDQSVVIQYSSLGKNHTAEARLLIGADGAFSKVRSLAFSHLPSPKLYITIQEWFQTTKNTNYYGAIFDDEITDFYSWTIPKENQLILGSALLPDKDVHRKFELLKNKLLTYGFDFSHSIMRNGAYLLRPQEKQQICIGSPQIALTGEAAGFISPSSAEGLSYAFNSAFCLAKALEPGIEDFSHRYLQNTKPLQKNILLKNLKSPAMYNPFLRRIIMKSGLLSIDMKETII